MTEPRLRTEQRRALALLAAAGRNGVPQPRLAVHSFRASMLAGLVNQGLATLTSSKVRVGGKMIELGRVRIKAAGRRLSRPKTERREPAKGRETAHGEPAEWSGAGVHAGVRRVRPISNSGRMCHVPGRLGVGLMQLMAPSEDRRPRPGIMALTVQGAGGKLIAVAKAHGGWTGGSRG
jgi:hypothetical protein